MMHGHEKSDPAIIVMKPANKAEGPPAARPAGEKHAAESVERRAGGQGEYASAKHVLDSEPGSRVKGAGAYTDTGAVIHPRREPYAGKLHVRIWAGGARKRVPTATSPSVQCASRRCGGVAARGAGTAGRSR